MKGISLRRMRHGDVPGVMDIEKRSFTSPWGAHLFHEEVDRDFSHPVVAVDEETGRVVGYIIFWVVYDECHILNIAVDPERRRQGIGEALMRHCEEVARAKRVPYIYLEVRESNRPAIALYKKLGYRFFGLRRGYYTDTKEDALVMAKFLRRE